MREKKTNFVVLRCRKCRAENADWELPDFMRQLGKEYEEKRIVLQFCGCVDGNTEHVIVGISTVHDKPRTPTHAHLDECAQCRNNPFNLCTMGAMLLSGTVQA